LGHVSVFVEEESLWLETVPHAVKPLLNHLGKYVLAEDVELHDRSAEYGALFISGPTAFETVIHPAFRVTDPFDLYGHLNLEGVSDEDSSRCVRRVDLLGAEGFLVSVKREAIAEFWKGLPAGKPAGSTAFHTLRIEAGMPLYGIDISEDNLAQEAGRSKQAISFTKGCYLGQEPIARLDALGHVNRELCGLRLCSIPAPEPGSPVFTSDGQKEIGTVTSSSVSYRDEKPVALAYLRSKFVQPGTQVAVKRSDERVDAVVFRPES